MLKRLAFSCFLALLAGFPGLSCATSIVGIRTPDAVVIAADSQLTIKGGAQPETQRVCKIFQAGKAFFTLTGFYKDPDRGFDITGLVPAILDQRLPLATAADHTAAGVAEALRRELQRLRKEAPEVFGRLFPSREGRVLRIFYAGFEGDTPVTVLTLFTYAVTPAGEVTVGSQSSTCPGSCTADSATYYLLTDRRVIDDYLATGKYQSRSPEETAKLFVELTIAAHLPDVGPPVDVLRIDRKGAAWVERKEECPAIAPIRLERTAQPEL
jgi:hypothetical protein